MDHKLHISPVLTLLDISGTETLTFFSSRYFFSQSVMHKKRYCLLFCSNKSHIANSAHRLNASRWNTVFFLKQIKVNTLLQEHPALCSYWFNITYVIQICVCLYLHFVVCCSNAWSVETGCTGASRSLCLGKSSSFAWETLFCCVSNWCVMS